MWIVSLLRRSVAARRAAAVTSLLIGFAFLLAAPPHAGYDENQRQLALDAFADGHGFLTKYSLVMPLVALVPYKLADLVGLGDLVRDHFAALLWIPWCWWTVRRLTKLRDVRFAIGVVVLTTISMFLPFASIFNAEAFSLMFVSAGLLCIIEERGRWCTLAGVALLTIGVANIPAQLFAAGAVGVVYWWKRGTPWIVVSAVAAFAVNLADASYSLGRLAYSKYDVLVPEAWTFDLLPWGRVHNFGYPFLFGLLGLTISLGHGVLWHIPSVFLRNAAAPADKVRTWRWTMTGMVAMMFVLYAKWWAWWGGMTFGARFFLLAVVPAALAVCDRVRYARTVTAWAVGALLAVWSAWVAIVGVLWFITPRSVEMCSSEGFRFYPLCWWVAEYSTLFAPTWDHESLRLRWIGFAVLMVALVGGAVAMNTSQEIRSRLRTMPLQLRTVARRGHAPGTRR